jgi:hypothetical protein
MVPDKVHQRFHQHVSCRHYAASEHDHLKVQRINQIDATDAEPASGFLEYGSGCGIPGLGGLKDQFTR